MDDETLFGSPADGLAFQELASARAGSPDVTEDAMFSGITTDITVPVTLTTVPITLSFVLVC